MEYISLLRARRSAYSTVVLVIKFTEGGGSQSKKNVRNGAPAG
jgi:hypothetical protein